MVDPAHRVPIQVLAVDTSHIPARRSFIYLTALVDLGESSIQAPFVDLNSANKPALKRVPGMAEAEADEIVAGQP